MVDEVLGLRDDGVITLVVPLTIWRGATQALDRAEFSILLGWAVSTACQVHKKSGRCSQEESTCRCFRKAQEKLRLEKRTRGMVCVPSCGSTMRRAIFDGRLACVESLHPNLLWSKE